MIGAGDSVCKAGSKPIDQTQVERVGREAWIDLIIQNQTLPNVNTRDRAIEIARVVLCEGGGFFVNPAHEVARRLERELRWEAGLEIPSTLKPQIERASKILLKDRGKGVKSLAIDNEKTDIFHDYKVGDRAVYEYVTMEKNSDGSVIKQRNKASGTIVEDSKHQCSKYAEAFRPDTYIVEGAYQCVSPVTIHVPMGSEGIKG